MFAERSCRGSLLLSRRDSQTDDGGIEFEILSTATRG